MKQLLKRCLIPLWGVATVLGWSTLSANPVVVPFERFGEEHGVRAGLQLLTELQCVRCHSMPESLVNFTHPKAQLSLASVGNRLSAPDLEAFLSDPKAFKPGTLMPKVAGLKTEEIRVLTQYLASLKSEGKRYEPGDVATGADLYHTLGCVACHAPASPNDYAPKEAIAGSLAKEFAYASVPLELGKHYAYDALVSFLLNPLEVRPAGRMPHFEMSEEEARHLATYLQRDTKIAAFESSQASPEALAQGRKIYVQQNCMACHETGEKEILEPRTGPALITLEEQQGCLSETPKHLDYALSPKQRLSLQETLRWVKRGETLPTSPADQQVDAYLTSMNCYACHEREGRGGMDDVRARYFTVHRPAAHSLGEIGMLPPKLEKTGRKLTVKWLEKLLWGEGGGVRPYMTARMPRFGEANVAGLIPAWVEASKQSPETKIDTTGLLRHQRSEFGRQLLGTGQGGLGCISCHGLQGRDSLGVPVIDLSQSVERLRPEFFKDLLLDPQKIQPGTLMPPLFMGRKKAEIEVEQIWTYLKEVDQFRLPDGLVKEGDYQLKPEVLKHPIVFRTFLEGAGTHAIAVGFPQGRHAAFDAHEVRWALVWEGAFLDAMSTWEERQMTPAKPLGSKRTLWSEHLPFAMEKETWPKKFGQAHGYQFKGYGLDAKGVPTLRYRVGTFLIEDRLEPHEEGGWRRRLTLEGPEGEKLWYRAGDGQAPVRVSSGTVLEERYQF